MIHKLKTFTNGAFFLILLWSFGCSSPNVPDPVKVRNNQYVIVKTTDLQFDKTSYGAFKLTRQDLAGQPNLVYEWLYLEPGDTRVLADSSGLVLGESSNEEKHGITFGQFNINWSFSKRGIGWLYPLPVDDTQHDFSYSTRFCVTELYELWGIDLAELECKYE